MALTKCLIANRGEIAVRLIRACRELGIGCVAVYSEADTQAQHVQLADKAYAIGPAAASESYLNPHKLLDAARQAGCDSLHPGYGFLSESADFAQAVLDAGLIWVGPPPQAIRTMGVKTEARRLMEQAGVPVVPGFQSESQDDAPFIAVAEDIGYPLMVKAAGGGGGKGIRVVRSADALPEALAGARREAAHAFGDPRVFLERYIEQGRHIEIQVLADAYGQCIHLFERECSTQRRHQKMIEESPSPVLVQQPTLRQMMGQAAVRAAQAVGYVNVGTVEFIVTPTGEFYFLEMNTRLQVEHPVTELVTGLDLVQLQLAIAAGEALPFAQTDVSLHGHAMECRLYAEDPHHQFLPATGPVLRFIAPQGPGIRVDSGIQTGDTIMHYYDPLLAKLIVHAPTRQAAIQRMQQALTDTVVLGVTTNLSFLQALLVHPVFQAGVVDTMFVDQHLQAMLPEQSSIPDLAFIIAALEDRYNREHTGTQSVADGDVYSPWARADGFRPGQK